MTDKQNPKQDPAPLRLPISRDSQEIDTGAALHLYRPRKRIRQWMRAHKLGLCVAVVVAAVSLYFFFSPR